MIVNGTKDVVLGIIVIVKGLPESPQGHCSGSSLSLALITQ
jgi:hypothetical protein